MNLENVINKNIFDKNNFDGKTFDKNIFDKYKFDKNQKGVTIIMLIIAIAMIAIVVTFAVFYSKDTTPEAKLASAYASLKSVKDSCDNALMLIEINPLEYDEYYFFGNNIHHTITDSDELNSYAANCGLASSADFSDRTYLIKPAENEEEKRILQNLELKGVTSTYIVDLEKNDYYIVGGAERVDGNIVYEYKDIVTAYDILVD